MIDQNAAGGHSPRVNIKGTPASVVFETQAFRVYRQLEDEILRGQLPPGQRLTRRDLSRRFEVSQATVSEALWRLEADGLAESAPMYGTRVTQVTLDRMREELILREALECQVARQAAKYIQAADHARLGELADRVDAALQRAGGYSREDMELHQELHLSLARLTRCPLLIREVESLWRRHFMVFTWITGKVYPSPENWHRILLDAISTQDADVAERAMREHILHGSDYQLEALKESLREAGTG